MKRYKRGLVALSADPITFGHLDLVRRACEQCESVVVLISNNGLKKSSYLFSLEDRVRMSSEAIRQCGLDGIQVIGSSGLLVDVYLREGCDVAFRGIRNEKDREFEKEQVQLHASILPRFGDHVVYLESKEEYRMVSSSLVKAFVEQHVDVSRFVPAFIQQLLEERMCRQFKIAITGCQASGKTSVADRLAKYFVGQGVPAHTINIDELVRRLYEEDSVGAQSVRDGLAHMYGEAILTADRKSIHRSVLKKGIFAVQSDVHKREQAHRLVGPHIGRLYREALTGKEGLIIVEWAQLAEMNMSHWTNHQVIVVSAGDAEAFASARSIDPEEQASVARFQWGTDQKTAVLYEAASKAKHGTTLRYMNRIDDAGALLVLAQSIGELFPELKTLRGEHHAYRPI